MIKIFISFFYILFISVGMGLFYSKWIRFENKNLFFTVFSGLFSQLVLSTFYAAFFPIDHVFYILNLTIASVVIAFNSNVFKKILFRSIKTFKDFSSSSKIIFCVIILLSLIHSSSLPFLTDNESYYIQTIKWLNKYGLVKGVSNVHLFLAQTSGWHILQSGFNFSFWDSNFNDLNGFTIIISSYLSLECWENYKKDLEKTELFIALMLISLIFLFLFIGSPSPDLALIVLVPVIFGLFIESFKTIDKKNISLMAILILLIILIKITLAPIILLLFIVLGLRYKNTNFKFIGIISIIGFISFVLKNLIVSGYPLYPISLGNELFTLDWKLNSDVQIMFYRLTSMHAWQINNWEEFCGLNDFEKFWIWLKLPKLNGLFNKLIIASVLIFPFFTKRKKEFYYLYVYFLIQFSVFYFTSPQYRFFVPVLLSIGLLIFSELLHKKLIVVKALMTLNILVLLLVGIMGLDFLGVTNSSIMVGKKPFVSSQLISPRSITQFENLEYSKVEIGNLKYFTPSKDSLFFWQTSDGPLPTAGKEMTDYFTIYYNHTPQMRTDNLKDGFKSVENVQKQLE